MKIRCLGDGIGAEITGVDIRALQEDEFAQIYRAWLDYNVIAVRGQELTAPQFLEYSRRFGALSPHPSKNTRHPDYPEITMLGVNKYGPDGKLNMRIYGRGSEGFHTDGNYEKVPFKATQLYALAIPSRGGDTYFASMYAAYDALPASLKTQLEGVHGIYLYAGRKTERSYFLSEEDYKAAEPVRHLILGTHPETGRRVLFFDSIKIAGIEGMAEKEGNELIEELARYMVQPHARYTHKWSKGDVVIWDNRSSYHKAAADYPPEEDRIHWRVSIKEFPVN